MHGLSVNWARTKQSSPTSLKPLSLYHSCAFSERVRTANAWVVGVMATVCALEKDWMIDSHQLRCRTTLKEALIRTGGCSSPWF